MYDVMEGIKVIEVAEHTFAPAAGMILADWGADVIKVEKTTGGGDPGRNLGIPNSRRDDLCMYFESGNRGKRSIALDLTQAEGRDILYRLVETADVFVTNFRTDARRRIGIETDTIRAINPRIIYARATGYGLKGALANDGGFDYPSGWCRGGSAFMQTLPGAPPPMQPGSIGDLGGGAMLAGAISAALFRRERTGKGAIVDNALYASGIYLMSQNIAGAGLGFAPAAVAREDFNALVSVYRTSDDRWISICILLERWWQDFARHLDRPDLIGDPRFDTAANRGLNKRPLVAELEAIFATRTYADWTDRFKTLEGVWAPVQNPNEIIADPQALENGFVVPVSASSGREYLASASAAQFDEAAIGRLTAAPGHGEHSRSILGELGLSAQTIQDLHDRKIMK